MTRDRCDLALIVGAARSGTTLTRLLLDAHPEVGAPAEAGLPALMWHLARVWSIVNDDAVPSSAMGVDPGVGATDNRHAPGWPGVTANHSGDVNVDRPEALLRWNLTPAARAWIRTTVLAVMEEYCRRERKRLYCDKSLDSGHHLSLVCEIFPGTRAVLVFRHVMDTIASGIEASPWGFSAYGYGPYVQSWPGNTVAALATYWLDHVERALSWEKDHPELCHRVRYEDLVLAPERTIRGLQKFLGVHTDVSVLSRAFSRDPSRGPGDYKIEHTTGVHSQSIGKGKRVPVSMLPPPLLDAVQEKLEVLGYGRLDRGWNAAERDVDAGGSGPWAARLAKLMCELEFPRSDASVGPFAIVTEDHRALRWVVEPESGAIVQGDGEVDAVLTGTAEDLVVMLTGEENLGVLLRSGRVRHVIADEDHEAGRDLLREVSALVTLLRSALKDNLQGVLVG